MRYHSLPLFSEARYAALNADRYAEDESLVAGLRDALALDATQRRGILERARAWVQAIRDTPARTGRLDAFLTEYRLDGREGLALLCLAEALLRIPDSATQDALIRDKLEGTDWRTPPDRAGSFFVNAATWAPMLSGRLVSWADNPAQDLLGALRGLAERAGEPLIREALRRAMGLLAEQFVMGRTIEEALARSAQGDEACFRHSLDMLGEAARTAADARAYRERYHAAIAAVSRAAAGQGPVAGPGVSVKLSALHPRLEPTQGERVRAELLPQLVELAQAAKDCDIGLTIDAEEATRLDLSYLACAQARSSARCCTRSATTPTTWIGSSSSSTRPASGSPSGCTAASTVPSPASSGRSAPATATSIAP